MIDLKNSNISYMLFSPENNNLSIMENSIRCDKLMSMLYSMNYSLISITSYSKGIYEKNYLAICPENNETLRSEAIFILNEFNKSDIIVKYKGENILSKIIFNGIEIPVEITYYDDNVNKKMYIHEGVSFTLNDKKRYIYPKKKEDIKTGIVLEYFNNNNWCAKKVNNIDSEYEKIYKLLMKYEKIRIPV